MAEIEQQHEKEGKKRSKLTEKIEEHLSEESFDDDLASGSDFNVFSFITI
jgi:hypothetical protein